MDVQLTAASDIVDKFDELLASRGISIPRHPQTNADMLPFWYLLKLRTLGDTAWLRERHGFWGRTASFQLETLIVEHSKPPAWRIMVIREHWWHGPERKAVRSGQWVKLIDGERKAALKWFERQEALMDK